MNAIPGYYKAERDYHSPPASRTSPDEITDILRRADEYLTGWCESYLSGNFEDSQQILFACADMEDALNDLRRIARRVEELEEDL